MWKLTGIPLALLVMAVCASGADAAGKVTADPNTFGRAVAASSTPLQTDARLTQKISYEAVHKPVSLIVSDLARMTGITLSAGYNSQDWQVRDRKMNIFAKDIRLDHLMESIARVMEFQWCRSSDTHSPTYRLVQNRRLIGKMVAEQAKKQESFEDEITRRRQKLLDSLSRLSDLSDADGEKLRNQNPYLYQLWKTGAAKVSTAIFNEMPDVADTFVGAKMNIMIPVSSLSSSTQQLLLEAMRGNWPYRQFQLGSNQVFPEEVASQLSNATIHIENIPRPFTDWENQLGSNFGGFGVQTPIGHFLVCSYTDPDSAGQQLNADYYLRGVEQKATQEQIQSELSADPRHGKAEKQDAELNEPFLTIDPVAVHEDDPDLQGNATLKVEEMPLTDNPYDQAWQRLAAIQKAFASASGFNVVSDSFTLVSGSMPVGHNPERLQNTLDSFAKGYSYNWTKNGRTVEFRYRDWFKKRSSQLPDAWLERWRHMLLSQGTLKLSEFAQIATLTFEQLKENIVVDSVLNCCASPPASVINNQAVLNLYLSLDSSESDALFSSAGLPLTSLNVDQSQLAMATIQYRYNPAVKPSSSTQGLPQGLVFKGSSTRLKSGITEVSFSLISQQAAPAKSTRLASWYVDLPRYVPPKSKPSSTGAQKK